MEIREMTDRQHLSYLQGRIAAGLELLSSTGTGYIIEALKTDIDELVVWLDGLLEDDELIVVDGPGEIIPDITLNSLLDDKEKKDPENGTTSLKSMNGYNKVKTITRDEVLAKVNPDDYDDIPAFTTAILEKMNCTKTALFNLLEIDSSAISVVVNQHKVYPYVEKAFRRVFQFPRPEVRPNAIDLGEKIRQSLTTTKEA